MGSAFHQAPNKNKLQVRRFRPSCSLLILWVQLTAHSDTRLTAVIAGNQMSGGKYVKKRGCCIIGTHAVFMLKR